MWFDESREIKLIELGNKYLRISFVNISLLKQILILDENNYFYIIHFAE